METEYTGPEIVPQNNLNPRNPETKTFLAYPENPQARGNYDSDPEKAKKLEAYLENQMAARQLLVEMVEVATNDSPLTQEEFEQQFKLSHKVAIEGLDGNNKIRNDVSHPGEYRSNYYYSKIPDNVTSEVQNIASNYKFDIIKRPDVVRVRRFTNPLNRDDATGYTNADNVHNYPTGGHIKKYMRVATEIFNEYTQTDPNDKDALISKAAELHQVLTLAHPFEAGNQSLSMNLVNAMLESRNIKGISHGITDGVALLTKPEDYQRYFKDQVNSQQ